MRVRSYLATWTMRLLLAASFFLGSEVLLWTGLSDSTAIDWAVRLVGYIALATLVLDLVVRFRVRDIYDMMTLITIYSLLVGLLINPQVAFADFPLTLMTRVIGGYNSIGIMTFGLFLILIAGNRRRYILNLMLIAGWLGFYWGIWMRWQPPLNELFDVVTLPEMFAIVSATIFAIYALGLIVSRTAQNMQPDTLQLSLVELLLLVLALLVLFIWQAANEQFGFGILVGIAALIGLCLGVLWFRRDHDDPTLLERHWPVIPLAPRWSGLATVVFFGATIFSYHLPFFSFQRLDQLFIMEAYFAAAGALWLPLVAVVIAARGIDLQLRTGVLD